MRVLFIGSKTSGLDALKTLLRIVPGELCGAITIDDSGDDRSELGSLRECCLGAAIPFQIAESRAESERLIADYKPDWSIVFGWYWILDVARLPGAFVGVHYSPLPKYRGSSPLVWQIMRGEARTCATLFQFDEGMDTGGIFDQRFTDIAPSDYIAEVGDRLSILSMEMLTHCVPQLIKGTLGPRPQDHSQATYCSQRRPEDGRIDWRESADSVYNAIRAQSRPYPGAYTVLNGKRVTLWRARRFEPDYSGVPGAVVRVSEDGVYVICGDHRAVILEEAQLEGEQPAPANRIIRSSKVRLASLG